MTSRVLVLIGLLLVNGACSKAQTIPRGQSAREVEEWCRKAGFVVTQTATQRLFLKGELRDFGTIRCMNGTGSFEEVVAYALDGIVYGVDRVPSPSGDAAMPSWEGVPVKLSKGGAGLIDFAAPRYWRQENGRHELVDYSPLIDAKLIQTASAIWELSSAVRRADSASLRSMGRQFDPRADQLGPLFLTMTPDQFKQTAKSLGFPACSDQEDVLPDRATLQPNARRGLGTVKRLPTWPVHGVGCDYERRVATYGDSVRLLGLFRDGKLFMVRAKIARGPENADKFDLFARLVRRGWSPTMTTKRRGSSSATTMVFGSSVLHLEERTKAGKRRKNLAFVWGDLGELGALCGEAAAGLPVSAACDRFTFLVKHPTISCPPDSAPVSKFTVSNHRLRRVEACDGPGGPIKVWSFDDRGRMVVSSEAVITGDDRGAPAFAKCTGEGGQLGACDDRSAAIQELCADCVEACVDRSAANETYSCSGPDHLLDRFNPSPSMACAEAAKACEGGCSSIWGDSACVLAVKDLEDHFAVPKLVDSSGTYEMSYPSGAVRAPYELLKLVQNGDRVTGYIHHVDGHEQYVEGRAFGDTIALKCDQLGALSCSLEGRWIETKFQGRLSYSPYLGAQATGSIPVSFGRPSQ